MARWDEIRRLAREKHAQALAHTKGDPSAKALLAAAAALTGFTRRGLPKGDPYLFGGDALLDPQGRSIWFNQDADPLLVSLYQAHEYGHFWIDGARATCTAQDMEVQAREERTSLGILRVEGYGPQEHRECQANVFAREFLLPTPTVRRWFRDEGLNAQAIISRVGLPDAIVYHQLARALLTPETDDEKPEMPRVGSTSSLALSPLDASQRRAAETTECPFLLTAGPGTGKTKTLIGRVSFLLSAGNVAPDSILALTFSNKAAEEMRERLAQTEAAAAPHLWMGTIHAFALELLRKYGTLIGLTPKPDVRAPTEALFLLEQELPSLGLHYYQNLYEPVVVLRDLLAAISRAKDELVEPSAYQALAARMADAAKQAATGGVEAAERAAKAMEVARVYAHYQEYLDKGHLLDFGDLIAKAIMLLQQHPEVREDVRATYHHILVDEYQDVNRASAVLLRELAGDGRGLWVVGDARQSIYRFRGAAPSNLRRFGEDFPGATTDALAVNYRSRRAIVDTIATLAPHMQAVSSLGFTPWNVDRRDAVGEVDFEIADDLTAEAEGIAREIQRKRHEGIAYRDQAILCRSHTQLARIALVLEREGIPLLYLGDLFERPEIRDLLALVSLAAGGDGRGLVRVARFAEYAIPLADVLALLALAKERSVPFPRALALAAGEPALSAAGKAGIALLDVHLKDLCYGTSAWGFLMGYLFTRSAYLRVRLGDASAVGQQRRVALYQFLQFAYEQRAAPGPPGTDPKRAFLRLVRRLETFGEEKQLREVPEWAGGIEAVRLLTVHASKGLEFGAVYVPTLGQRYFPASRQYQPCPPPDGMLQDVGDADHEEEEECLFFVALSRARDTLCLSRARRYGELPSHPSRLLEPIASHLPRPTDGPVTWPRRESPRPRPSSPAPDDPPIFDVRALDLYLKCPRQYYYEHILGLGGKRDDSAHMQFHTCVYTLLRWIREQQAAGHVVDDVAVQQRLAEIWAEQGPRDHPYESIYRRNAEEMSTRGLRRLSRSSRLIERPTWEIVLPHGRVRLVPDHVEARDDGTIVYQRLRTGRVSTGEKDRNIYALYYAGGADTESGTKWEVRVFSLSTEQDEPVTMKKPALATRRERYDTAIAGIMEGDFPPKPDDRECPRRPHYFICPLAEDR